MPLRVHSANEPKQKRKIHEIFFFTVKLALASTIAIALMGWAEATKCIAEHSK